MIVENYDEYDFFYCPCQSHKTSSIALLLSLIVRQDARERCVNADNRCIIAKNSRLNADNRRFIAQNSCRNAADSCAVRFVVLIQLFSRNKIYAKF